MAEKKKGILSRLLSKSNKDKSGGSCCGRIVEIPEQDAPQAEELATKPATTGARESAEREGYGQ